MYWSNHHFLIENVCCLFYLKFSNFFINCSFNVTKMLKFYKPHVYWKRYFIRTESEVNGIPNPAFEKERTIEKKTKTFGELNFSKKIFWFFFSNYFSLECLFFLLWSRRFPFSPRGLYNYSFARIDIWQYLFFSLKKLFIIKQRNEKGETTEEVVPLPLANMSPEEPRARFWQSHWNWKRFFLMFVRFYEVVSHFGFFFENC